MPHKNGLTFSRQRTLPTRPLPPWLAPRAKKSRQSAVEPFSGPTAARTYRGQVRVRCPYSWGRDLLRYSGRFAVTVALISCVLLEVNKNQQKTELRSDFFLRMGLQSVTSVLGTACGGVLRPCSGSLPCISGGSSSRHSRVSNSPVPRRLDRSLRRAPPVLRRCR